MGSTELLLKKRFHQKALHQKEAVIDKRTEFQLTFHYSRTLFVSRCSLDLAWEGFVWFGHLASFLKEIENYFRISITQLVD